MRTILFAAATIAIVGCATTGGTIGGLFPAPKFLKGEIKNDIYIARDKSFSVAVPHKDGSYEYTYMQVKEQYSEYGAYVSFGPAALDLSIYRIEIGKRLTPDSERVNFDEVAPKVVEGYKSQLQNSYGTAPQEVESRQETIGGRKAHYWKFTQIVPAGKFTNNREAIFTHEIYVMDFQKCAVTVWVQIPETTKKPAIEAHAFAESVVVY